MVSAHIAMVREADLSGGSLTGAAETEHGAGVVMMTVAAPVPSAEWHEQQ